MESKHQAQTHFPFAYVPRGWTSWMDLVPDCENAWLQRLLMN